MREIPGDGARFTLGGQVVIHIFSLSSAAVYVEDAASSQTRGSIMVLVLVRRSSPRA